MQRLRRADEAIVERLPDPLIVLAADRSVRRANSAAQAAFGADMAAVLRHPGLRGGDRPGVCQGHPGGAPRGPGEDRRRLRSSCRRRWRAKLHATVVPMDPPLADGGAHRGGAVGPLA